MIRPSSERKNPAGAGIFAERRIRSFSGIKRVSKLFLISVPLIRSKAKPNGIPKGAPPFGRGIVKRGMYTPFKCGKSCL